MQKSTHIFAWAGLVLVCLAGSVMWADQSSQSAVMVDVLPAELASHRLEANWLSYNGDYSGRRFSSLDQINTSTVAQLRAQWVFHTNSSDRMEATPVVVNGIMFATAANDTYALDASTGREIWRYTRPISEGLIDDASRHISRGV